ncbi:MAG: hypothetical protein HFH08_02510 [Bacilli bacterium]|nr:hypothetical protein [Bacilli bacterium]
MKEIVCYILPVIVVFCLIGVIESAMLFEDAQEEVSSLCSKNFRKEDGYGNIESRELM